MAGTPTFTQADAIIDRSGSIAVGGTAQQLMQANGYRKGFCLQNTSAADLWFNDQGNASAQSPSIKLASGAYYETPINGVPRGVISIFGATGAQTFSAREW